MITVFSSLMLGAIGLWSVGKLISGISNAHAMVQTNGTLAALNKRPVPRCACARCWRCSSVLAFYEHRTQDHAPLLSRFGLNHYREVLGPPWTLYVRKSRAQLSAPVQQSIEDRLVDPGQMATTQIDDQLTQLH